MTETQREPVPHLSGDELTIAPSFLDFARTAVLKKAEGLDEADITRPMVPTGTSVLRLIRHLTDGERFWFRVNLLGEGTEPDWNAAQTDDRDSRDIIADYRAAIEQSNAAVRHLGDPDALAARPIDGMQHSLRWIIAHMTSETARHAGHADIIRELSTGSPDADPQPGAGTSPQVSMRQGSAQSRSRRVKSSGFRGWLGSFDDPRRWPRSGPRSRRSAGRPVCR